jgi:hypothetical protein
LEFHQLWRLGMIAVSVGTPEMQAPDDDVRAKNQAIQLQQCHANEQKRSEQRTTADIEWEGDNLRLSAEEVQRRIFGRGSVTLDLPFLIAKQQEVLAYVSQRSREGSFKLLSGEAGSEWHGVEPAYLHFLQEQKQVGFSGVQKIDVNTLFVESRQREASGVYAINAIVLYARVLQRQWLQRL